MIGHPWGLRVVKKLLLGFLVLGLLPASGLAGPNDTIHTMANVHEDALAGSQSTKARFDGRHAGTSTVPYRFELTIQKVSGSGQGPNLVFREVDANNFNQLDFRPSEVVLKQKVAGSMTTKGRGCRGFGAAGQDYSGTLYLKGNRFEFYEAGATAPCVAWTDPNNRFPVGENASYYCMPGTYCLWKKVLAAPQDIAASPPAWNFTNQAPGYLSSQPISSSSQSILTSRYPYTVQNYTFGIGVNGGSSSTADHVEHGADGNVEYHMDEWSKFGTALVYRATVGQVGYHLRLNSGNSEIGYKPSGGTYTRLATGPAVPLNRHMMLKLDGSRHRLIDEVTGQVYIDLTNSRYTRGDKTYWMAANSTEPFRGSFIPRP
jgi:hypothetical protein